MKKLIYCLLFVWPLLAQAKLDVVATLPDFGAIAQEIGGDKINVNTITKGTEDPHFVDARPSLVRVLNKADVLIEGGAELEAGWLPPLVNGARNSKILGDAPGHLVMAKHVQLKGIPTGPVDRSMGDVHPFGNPHFWLDPENGKRMAGAMAATFSLLDPANKAVYQQNLQQFSDRLDQKVQEWTKALEPFKGTKVVTYHKSFDYFLERFGFELVGTIEPKPGIEPSPSYINSLLPRLKDAGVKLVIIESFRSRKTPQYVAEAAGARLLVCADKVGAVNKVRDYFGVFDYNVGLITAALKSTK